MPEGIETTVEDGFATIDFIDRAKRGPGIRALLDKYGPEVIETLTRSGPRRLYRVPEGNAREAGLLDEPAASPDKPFHQRSVRHTPPAKPAVSVPNPNTYDDGFPDMDWHRDAINAYAAKVGVESPAALPNKRAVLDAIAAKA